VRFGDGKNTAEPNQLNFDAKQRERYSVAGTSRKETVSVRAFRPNALGPHHMSENVWEWTQDAYASDYKQVGVDNPVYTRSGEYGVHRGGSWHTGPRELRCSYRYSYSPDLRGYGFGFRVARAR